MPVTTSWKLHSENLAELEVEGVTLQDVIRVIHWRCIATDGENSAEIYGSHQIPAPTSPAGYIPIDSIKEMDPEPRRATILGWAEMIDPGFVAAAESAAAARLVAMTTAPATTRTEII